jgi:hypothetical protein
MRPTAVSASALVRPTLVLALTNAVPGSCGGHGADGGIGGGDGGGGPGQVETGPWTPVRVIAREHTVPPLTLTF